MLLLDMVNWLQKQQKEHKTFYDVAQVPMIKQIYLDFLILNTALKYIFFPLIFFWLCFNDLVEVIKLFLLFCIH